MKHRIPALLAALTLILALAPSALAAPEGVFVRTRTYTGQFSDVAPGSVFYDNIAALYEYGLSNGRSGGVYAPQETMTLGEVVIFAGRIRSLSRTGDAETGPAAYRQEGAALSQGYYRYLQAEGVLGPEWEGSLSLPATRVQVAHALANLLPALEPINDEAVTQGYATRRYVTDVTEYTPYFREILLLYRAGITAGSGETASFYPEDSITRGAAAAMLTRLMDPALRITLDWQIPTAASAQGTTLASLIEPGNYIAAPATVQEMDESVRYMLSGGENSLSLQYPGLTPVLARDIMNMALTAVKSYCEQGYNTVHCSYLPSGRIILRFSAASLGENTEEYREKTMERAIAVHDQLWDSGALQASMTEREKARVYYDWVCANCVYDYDAGDDSISHVAYSLFEKGVSVCDGYTGAYNLLLKLEGIQCTALSNRDHIWTVAVLDGEEVHIDTTWGDSGETPDPRYFAMTEQQSWGYHKW